jgi:U3 small nucleolar RNA-associated protein 5
MPIPNAHMLEHTNNQDATLQERLQALTIPAETSKSTSAVPKAESMHSVLMQGLHTKDKALIESSLQVSDPAVIRNTGLFLYRFLFTRLVQQLPSAYVVSFLAFMVDKFQNKPSRAELIPWMKALIVYHSAYLMAVPDLVQSLSALYATVNSRLQVFPHLLKLSGRLDVLLSQVVL